MARALRYLKDTARWVWNSMADMAMFPIEAWWWTAKQINKWLDAILWNSDWKEANKKIDKVVKWITEQSKNREEWDDANVAYQIWEWLWEWLQLASMLVWWAAWAKQWLKQIAKWADNVKPTLSNLMSDIEKWVKARSNTKIPKVVETTNNPAPSRWFSSKPLNTSRARAEATMRRNMSALERDAEQAVNDARTMSLDDMLKQWKSQQNG